MKRRSEKNISTRSNMIIGGIIYDTGLLYWRNQGYCQREKVAHVKQELYFAEREMQKNIIEYNMKIYAAALSAIERVTTYHFPELHPEEKEQLTIATILSEIRECLSSSNYISHFRSANSVDSIVLKMKNGQEYVLSIRENK